MKQWFVLAGIFLAVIGMMTIGEPIETTDTPKSVTNKAVNNMVVDTLEDTTKDTTNQLGELTVKNNCKDPNSQSCKTTKSSVSIIGIIVTLFFGILAILGILFFAKIILSVFSNL